jgi:hypothetical protein
MDGAFLFSRPGICIEGLGDAGKDAFVVGVLEFLFGV